LNWRGNGWRQEKKNEAVSEIWDISGELFENGSIYSKVRHLTNAMIEYNPGVFDGKDQPYRRRKRDSN
jgi:predicted SnoaL-like aldol condensation-catalyzing enzyme